MSTNAGLVDIMAFDSADPNTPLTLSRPCSFFLLNTTKCDSKLDKPGRNDVTIVVLKGPSDAAMNIRVGSDSFSLKGVVLTVRPV